MTAHAKLSASGAHRWMNCPGSVAAESGYGETTSSYAQEGTNAHTLADTCLVNDEDAILYEGVQKHFDFEVTQEMAENVQIYLDYVRALPGDMFSEVKVEFDDWVPGGFGTSDAVVIQDRLCTIADLKYGKGVEVSAEDNAQLKLYALGAYAHFNFIYEIEEFRLAVVQPRLGVDGVISEWNISVPDLLAWGEEVKDLAERALAKDAERVPGPTQCRWCKAQANCKAFAVHNLKVISDGFVDLDAPVEVKDPDGLTLADLGTILPQVDAFKGWLSVIQARAAEEIMNGNDVPGYKMVEGRNSRHWSDEEAAEKALKRMVGAANAYEKKFLSPAKAESAIKDKKKRKRFIEKYVTNTPGKDTLVPEDNPKPAIVYDAAEGFESIENEETET